MEKQIQSLNSISISNFSSGKFKKPLKDSAFVSPISKFGSTRP